MVIVLLLHVLVVPIETVALLRFGIGTLFILIGLTIFLVGVDLGISPMGHHISMALTKFNKKRIVIITVVILGFFISVAEPDLHILANQVAMVTGGMVSKWQVILTVSIGIGLMLTLGIFRILYNIPLYKLLLVIYGLILLLSLLTTPEFLAISFDASGATTGAMTVPFIMALSIGAAAMKKDSKASEKDSFGLVAIASAGAIISLMVLNLILKTDKMSGSLQLKFGSEEGILQPFLENVPHLAIELLLALSPFLIIFVLFKFLFIRLQLRQFFKILMGMIYTYVGLLLFLLGVNSGFMFVGNLIGIQLSKSSFHFILIPIGFLLGFVTILAEPAVHVLTKQIEEVTSGYVKKSAVLVSLCLGVGLAVMLSVIRIMIEPLQLWHFLLPGYGIAIIFMFVAPKLFVGIAFDAGGVATGPMTATFILAFIQGTAEGISTADVLRDGFGMIAMVAMMPIITLEILGIIYKIKTKGQEAKNNE